MGNIFNTDFQELLFALNENSVEYILIGGYAVILHGYPRTTGDMDIWINPNPDNYQNLIKAFHQFGFPLMPFHEFADPSNEVFSYGRPPNAIDILTCCKGLQFEEAYQNIQLYSEGGINIKLLSLADLIKAKQASGRYKDLNDIEHLPK